MDSTENKPPEDSILCSNTKEFFSFMSKVIGILFMYMLVAGMVTIVWASVQRRIVHASSFKKFQELVYYTEISNRASIYTAFSS
jgi:membrane-bound ClpP family serine protease